MHKPNAECAVCEKPVYRRKRDLNSKSGKVFCSKACYGKWCRKPKTCPVCGDEFLAGNSRRITCSKACSNKKRTGIKYGQGQPNSHMARKKRLRKMLGELRGEQCERCPYNRLPEILIVHHKVHRADGGTDDPENLELLCPNCHAEEHYGLEKKNDV